jgi:hypothetical protein
MNKKLPVIAFGLVALAFASCQEKAPEINFGTAATVDTTFVLPAGTVPAADAHNVLIEEFTGQTCTNCPAAHDQIHLIDSTYPGRINATGLYAYGVPQAKPPAGGTDLRDSTATTIMNNIYVGLIGIPAAGINRVASSSGRALFQSDWNATVIQQMSVVDSVNLNIVSKYNATANTDTVIVTVTYVHPVAYPHNLCIAVVEDSIVDKQEFPGGSPYPDNIDDAYLFTNVFRGMVNSTASGDGILPAIPAKEAGRVYIRKYVYQPKSNVNVAHCRLIAYVAAVNGSDSHVLQSVQTRMK